MVTLRSEARVWRGAAERINDERTLTGKLMSDQIFQVLPRFLREQFCCFRFTVAFIQTRHGIAGCIVTNDIFIFRRTTEVRYRYLTTIAPRLE